MNEIGYSVSKPPLLRSPAVVVRTIIRVREQHARIDARTRPAPVLIGWEPQAIDGRQSRI
jgi:hypothetical protein